ncbi:hypothetical protein D6777_04235 [Candidatus Woesearchaeota archaeon]|nr:MAG: hypothetical protein D6777_04235 [Candidatus Woesearchaeota archaeon]
MKKVLIVTNILLILAASYFIFGNNTTITGRAILGNDVILGSTLYYTVTDLENSDMISKEYVKNTEVFLARPEKEVKDFSRLIKLEEFDLTSDADNEKDYCQERTYHNIVYFYDLNNNKLREDNEELVYSTTTDDDGCFAIKLPDEDFVVSLRN